MATIQDLEVALKNADKAGDVDAATMLAAELARARQGAQMGGARPLPADSWAITGKDPAIGSAKAALIGAGRAGSQIEEGARQIGLSANVAGREAIGMQSGDQLRSLADQEKQQKEADRLYAPLKKEYPIATGAGETAPALTIPMGGATALARTAIPTVGMMALEASKYGSPRERAMRGASGAVGGLAGGITAEGISRAIMPIRDAASSGQQNLVRDLTERIGARPLPSQLADSPTLARIEDMLARSPGGAGPMSQFMQGNQRAVNRRAGKGIGESADALTSDVLGNAKTRIGANFNALRQNATMPSSQPVFDAIDEAKRWLMKGNEKATGKQEALDTLKRLEDQLYATKQLSGDEYKAWVSDLYSQASGTENQTVAAALKKVRKAMDAEAKANTAPTVDAQGKPVTWAESDKQWASLKTLLRPNAVNEVTGDVNAAAVRRAMNSELGDAARTGQVSGPMADVAAYGGGVPQLRPGSPTYERGQADSVIGLLKAIPKHIGAKALTSQGFSEYLTKGLLASPEASKPVSLAAARAAFPALAGYTDAQLAALLFGVPQVAEK